MRDAAKDSEEKLKDGESRGSSTEFGYRIEARTTMSPKVFGKQILTKEWARVYTKESHPGCGVPNNSWGHLDKHELLTYAQAQSLRWWFIAETGSYSGIETRLVKFKLETTHVITREEEVDELDGMDNKRPKTDG